MLNDILDEFTCEGATLSLYSRSQNRDRQIVFLDWNGTNREESVVTLSYAGREEEICNIVALTVSDFALGIVGGADQETGESLSSFKWPSACSRALFQTQLSRRWDLVTGVNHDALQLVAAALDPLRFRLWARSVAGASVSSDHHHHHRRDSPPTYSLLDSGARVSIAGGDAHGGGHSDWHPYMPSLLVFVCAVDLHAEQMKLLGRLPEEDAAGYCWLSVPVIYLAMRDLIAGISWLQLPNNVYLKTETDIHALSRYFRRFLVDTDTQQQGQGQEQEQEQEEDDYHHQQPRRAQWGTRHDMKEELGYLAKVLKGIPELMALEQICAARAAEHKSPDPRPRNGQTETHCDLLDGSGVTRCFMQSGLAWHWSESEREQKIFAGEVIIDNAMNAVKLRRQDVDILPLWDHLAAPHLETPLADTATATGRSRPCLLFDDRWVYFITPRGSECHVQWARNARETSPGRFLISLPAEVLNTGEQQAYSGQDVAQEYGVSDVSPFAGAHEDLYPLLVLYPVCTVCP